LGTLSTTRPRIPNWEQKKNAKMVLNKRKFGLTGNLSREPPTKSGGRTAKGQAGEKIRCIPVGGGRKKQAKRTAEKNGGGKGFVPSAASPLSNRGGPASSFGAQHGVEGNLN